MKKINIKVIFIYLLLLLFFLFNILNQFNVIKINIFIKYVLVLLLFLLEIFLFKNNYERKNFKEKELNKTIFIVIIPCLMFYFCIGLITGFSYNVFSIKNSNIILNIFSLTTIVLFNEYSRFLLLQYRNNEKKYIYLIILLFILFNINYYSLINNIKKFNLFFEFLITYLFPLISRQILLTYLTLIGNYKCSIFYSIIIQIFSYLVPILPNCNYFITSISFILIDTITLITLDYEIKMKKKLSIKERQNENPLSYISFLLITIILCCFILGFFKYEIISIKTNSMKPLFERGDAVIYKKIKDKNSLKVGDIIVFKQFDEIEVHRIVYISLKDKKYFFRTKGDNNGIVDKAIVKEDNIIGKYIFKIKYIGYPSVWLSDAF